MIELDWPDELEGFRNYRSPFSDCPDNRYIGPHRDWADFRKNYEETGNKVALNIMLKFVTADNPPLAESSFTDAHYDPSIVGSDNRNWQASLITLFAIIVGIALTVAGLFGGFPAVMAIIIIVIGMVFYISWLVNR